MNKFQVSEEKYHIAVRKAELIYGLSAIDPPCSVNVQCFLLDPTYRCIIFVLPNEDARRLRKRSLFCRKSLQQQLTSVRLPTHFEGFETSFCSLDEYDNP